MYLSLAKLMYQNVALGMRNEEIGTVRVPLVSISITSRTASMNFLGL